MSDPAAVERIKAVLAASDIVWPKYGSDTIDSLAERLFVQSLPGSGASYGDPAEEWTNGYIAGHECAQGSAVLASMVANDSETTPATHD